MSQTLESSGNLGKTWKVRILLLLDGTAVQKCFVPGAHAGHVNDGQLVILSAVPCSRQKVHSRKPRFGKLSV